MPAREICVGVVTHAGASRQQKRIVQADLREPIAADNGDDLAVVFCRLIARQDALKFGIKDIFADQPAAVVRKTGKILVFSREEFFMINIVRVLRSLQLCFQFRSVVLVSSCATHLLNSARSASVGGASSFGAYALSTTALELCLAIQAARLDLIWRSPQDGCPLRGIVAVTLETALGKDFAHRSV